MNSGQGQLSYEKTILGEKTENDQTFKKMTILGKKKKKQENDHFGTPS